MHRARQGRWSPVALVGILTALASSIAAADIRYVDASAPAGGNGLAWGTAFRTLQNALTAATSNPTITEIWVADGTYKPSKRLDGADPRSATFELKNGLTIYGGFAGNETSLAQRNPAVNIAILSGDLGVAGTSDDNAYHVVYSDGENATAAIDGFQIRDGYAYFGPGSATHGGGLRLFNTSAQVRNCLVTLCAADNYGGGAACLAGSNVAFTNCVFQSNACQSGPAAVEVQNSDATFTNCAFNANGPNGACRVYGDGSVGTFTGCVFQSNSGSNGAGIQMQTTGASATITDCQFKSHTGSPALSLQGEFSVTDCLFQSNQAGGLSYGNLVAPATLRDCTFLNNASVTGAGCITGGDDFLVVRNCSFKGNTNPTGFGGAVYAYQIGFVDCVFENNSASYGGAVRAQDGIWLVNCRLAGNHATNQGGGVFVSAGSPVTIANCLITGNTAGSYGGGIHASGSNLVTIEGCTIVGNSAPNGGGVLVETVTKIQNSLVWGNTGANGTTEQQQVRVLIPTSSLTLASDSIQGWSGSLTGTACDGNDPLFVGVAGIDTVLGTGDDSPAVVSGSSAIDSGNGLLVVADVVDADQDGNTAEALPLDLLGHARTQGLAVDRGAAETNPNAGGGIYVGPAGGSWFTPSNWGDGTVPDADTEVVVSTSVVIDQRGAVAGTVAVNAGGALATSGTLVASAITIASGGALSLDSAAASVTAEDVAIDGTLAFSAGTLTIDGGALTSAAEVSVGCSGAATLVLANAAVVVPSLHICANGFLAGDGAITAAVTNDGAIDPSGVSRLLSIDGSFTQSSSGTLHFDIASAAVNAEHDALVIAMGPASFGGGLEVALESSIAEPSSLALLTAPSSAAGAFAQVTLPAAVGEFAFAAPLAFGAVNFTSASTVPLGTRLFVRTNGSPLGTGSTWANALKNLSTAIAIAASNNAITEIWVGEGTYVPETDGTPSTPPDGPRSVSFRLLDNVSLVGGFAGTESAIAERDLAAHPTILSGDVVGNDTSNESTKLDNAYSVVIAVGVNANAAFDGFVVRGGWANGVSLSGVAGGGAHVASSNCTIRNSIFEANGASDGGAISLAGGSPTLDACTIRNNLDFGDTAAGVSVTGATATISNCAFETNKASDGAAAGLSASGGHVTVTECAFTSNVGIGARSEGGIAEFIGCDFIANADSGSLLVGAGATVVGGTATFSDCTFSGNVGLAGAGLELALTSNATLIDNCTFTSNVASSGGGGIFVSSCEPTISNCTFTDNQAFAGGGVAALSEQGHLVGLHLVDCVFTNNHAVSSTAAPSFGGGLSLVAGLPGALPVIAGCSFTGNTADNGGGAYLQEVVATFDGSTFSGNSADAGSGIALFFAGEIDGDCALDGLDELAVTHVLAPSSPNISPIGTITTNSLVLLERGPDYEDRPELLAQLGGSFPGTGYDVVDVSGGTATLTGTLRIQLANGYVPQAGDEYRVLKAGSMSGQFDAAVFTAVPNGLALTFEYDALGVIVKLARLGAEILFEDPTTSTLPGTPVDAVTADVDNDGDQDVIVLVAGASNEAIVVLVRNQGSSGGSWLGFAPAAVVATVGLAPTDLAVADVNGDGREDLVVVCAGTKTVSILLATGLASPAFSPPATLTLATAPAGAAFARPALGAAPDVWVTRPSNGLLQRLVNNGSGVFSLGAATATVANAGAATSADLDQDGLDDIVVGSASGNGSVAVHRNLGSGGLDTFVAFAVPSGPIGLVAGDIDNDGLLDIVATTSASVEVFRNIGTGAASLRAPVSIPAGSNCVSPTLLDAADDGDLDIGFVSLGAQPAEARIIRNDLDGTNVAFTAVNAVASPGLPSRSLGGDFDNDGVADLLVVGTPANDSRTGTGELHALLGAVTPVLLGDLNGDGLVGGADLAILLGAWGLGGSADLDGDGVVGGADLAILLGNWS